MDRSGIPKRINVRRDEGVMEIGWDDLNTDRIHLTELRRFCPCAVCVDMRDQESKRTGLHMITEAETATADLQSVTQVGLYAIQIVWGDGHDTGIYTYDYLRQLGDDSGDAHH